MTSSTIDTEPKKLEYTPEALAALGDLAVIELSLSASGIRSVSSGQKPVRGLETALVQLEQGVSLTVSLLRLLNVRAEYATDWPSLRIGKFDLVKFVGSSRGVELLGHLVEHARTSPESPGMAVDKLQQLMEYRHSKRVRNAVETLRNRGLAEYERTDDGESLVCLREHARQLFVNGPLSDALPSMPTGPRV